MEASSDLISVHFGWFSRQMVVGEGGQLTNQELSEPIAVLYVLRDPIVFYFCT